MASSVDYLQYVLDLLQDVPDVSYKKMMGEFLLYKNGVLFGGVYDDRFLLKKTPSNADLGLREELPYDGAKTMYLVDSEDPVAVRELVLKTIYSLCR